MADDKKTKDLTGILEVSRQMDAAGTLPPPPEGAILEEQKLEKIDDFESLEDYSKTNPPAELPPENDFAVTPPEAPADTQFPTTEEPAAPAEADAPPAESAGFTGAVTGAQSDNPLGVDGLAGAIPFSAPEAPSQLAGIDSTSGDSAPPEPAEAPASEPAATPAEHAAFSVNPTRDDYTSTPQLGAEHEDPTPISTPLRPLSTSTPMEKVREYSEQVVVGKPSVPASLPFSLIIEGRLTPLEREKLVDLLEREKVGIREMDLEPQFAGDRVLIPRISEYAGIILVQALRGTRARMRLGPSDSIFSTEDTRMKPEDEPLHEPVEHAEAFGDEIQHPAESMPLTPAASLPNLPVFVVVDAVTASAALKTSVVEAERSSQYQEILEALQRELKYKAYRKGANAVVSFSVTLTQLGLPTHYRLTAMGSAVKGEPKA